MAHRHLALLSSWARRSTLRDRHAQRHEGERQEIREAQLAGVVRGALLDKDMSSDRLEQIPQYGQKFPSAEAFVPGQLPTDGPPAAKRRPAGTVSL